MSSHEDSIRSRDVIDQRMVFYRLQEFICQALVCDVHHEVRRVRFLIRLIDAFRNVLLDAVDRRQEHRNEDHQEHDSKERALLSFNVGTK